jgi:hypothetical protein
MAVCSVSREEMKDLPEEGGYSPVEGMQKDPK